MRSVWLIGWVIVCFLTACKSEDSSETISFDELSKPASSTAEKDSVPSQQETKISAFESLSDLSKFVVDSLNFDSTSVVLIDSLFFPDRFGMPQAEKWSVKKGNDSLVFMHWKYAKGSVAQSTFYNWLDCFGVGCKSVQVGEKKNLTKRATLILQTGRHLIWVESGKKIDALRWARIVRNGLELKTWDFVLIQLPKGKVEWYKMNENAELEMFQDGQKITN